MRGGRVAILALALGLSGCLVSEEPLVAPGEAAFPLPDRASAERFHPDGNNGWAHEANDTAYRAGAAYIVTRENGDEMEMTLKRIAQDTFIAQAKGSDGGYLYGFLVFKGSTIYEYAPDCEDFDAGEMQRYGIVKKSDGDDCTVSSAQGLAAAYLDYLRKGKGASTAYVLH